MSNISRESVEYYKNLLLETRMRRAGQFIGRLYKDTKKNIEQLYKDAKKIKERLSLVVLLVVVLLVVMLYLMEQILLQMEQILLQMEQILFQLVRNQKIIRQPQDI